MLTFVILASKSGAPLAPEILFRTDQDDLPELHFEPDEHLFWTNQSGSVAFSGWQAFTEMYGMGSHWHTDDRGLTAFSGHAWPKETGWTQTGESWASQLNRFYETTPPEESRETLYGQFAAIRLPFNGDGWVGADILGLGMLYLAETDDLLIISNRSSLVARLVTPLGERPVRDPMGVLWMGLWNHGPPFSTGFTAVKPIQQNASIRFPVGSGPVITEHGRFLLHNVDGRPPEETDFETVADEVEADLRSTMAITSRLPSASGRELRLSGGKDSRMLLAVALRSGLESEFTLHTFGSRWNRDTLVAHEIARQFNLPWTFEHRNTRDVAHVQELLASHVFHSEGMVSFADLSGTTSVSDRIVVTGTIGELMRINARYQHAADASDPEEIFERYVGAAYWDQGHLIRDDVRAELNRAFKDWSFSLSELETNFARNLATGRQLIMVRCWVGLSRSSKPDFWIVPFVSATCVRAVHRISADRFITERFHFEIIRRASERLAHIPFADEPWRSEAIEGYARAEELSKVERWSAPSSGAPNARARRFAELSPLFQDVLSDRSNPIHDYVNSEALLDSVRKPPTNPKAFRQLHGILTAAIWLGEHESSTRIRRD